MEVMVSEINLKNQFCLKNSSTQGPKTISPSLSYLPSSFTLQKMSNVMENLKCWN